MLILGVDPGSNVTGYGIVKKNRACSTHVASGVIRTSGKWRPTKTPVADLS